MTADYAVSFGSGAGFASSADLAGATAGTTAGTVSFAARETSRTIMLQVATDTVGEADERFSLVLSDATGWADIGREAGDDLLDGGAGFDTVTYADATGPVNVRLDTRARQTG